MPPKKQPAKKSISKQTVFDKILETDKKFRYEGVTEDIHTLDTLVSDKSLDYDVPTLCDDDIDRPNILLNSIEKFKTKFYEKYPFLKGIDMTNLLIAGGSVSNIIRDKYSSDSDIDFFIYGLNQKKATERIKKWILDIVKPKPKSTSKAKSNAKSKAKKNYTESEDDESDNESDAVELDDVKIFRNNNMVALLIDDDIKIQLIFRLYKTVSEILHGFDLGSSAVGFDGENVYLTTLGKYCHEYRCNVVDTTRRSTTYEYRLNKYFNRGFNIVLPGLDINKLRTTYLKYGELEICELPHFIFSYKEIIGNKIMIKRFYNKYGSTSDYELEPMDLNNLYYQSFNINLSSLINGVDYYYYVSSSYEKETLDIFNVPPRINKGMIISFYDSLKKKISKRKFDITSIKKYISVEKLEVIAKNMFKEGVNTKEYMNKLIDRQVEEAFVKLDQLLAKDHSKIEWITKNPGTQLTGSFNPIIEDEHEWYGEYYR